MRQTIIVAEGKADLDRTTTRGAGCGPPRKSEACVACALLSMHQSPEISANVRLCCKTAEIGIFGNSSAAHE